MPTSPPVSPGLAPSLCVLGGGKHSAENRPRLPPPAAPGRGAQRAAQRA